MRWWKQAVIDLAGAREAASEMVEEEGGEEVQGEERKTTVLGQQKRKYNVS